VPSPAGQQLIEHGRRVLAEVAEARRRLSDVAGHLSGNLKVGAIPTIAPFLLPAVIGRFERKYPEVDLSVLEDTTGRLVEALTRGELDLVIASGAPPTPHLHEETLIDEPLLLMLPAAYRWHGGGKSRGRALPTSASLRSMKCTVLRTRPNRSARASGCTRRW
jgi:LysR family transcriptional regulator, hydrogen peroxide-inducible genes activator